MVLGKSTKISMMKMFFYPLKEIIFFPLCASGLGVEFNL